MRFAVLVVLSVLPVWAARQAGIVVDGQLEPPARYGTFYPPPALCGPYNAASPSPLREKLLFDHDWRFFPGDPSGAESPGFEAGGWLDLDLPHDWSIEGKIDPKNPMGGSGGFFPVGIGWYRRNLMSGSPICAM